jgi:hypothetical protein
MASRRSAGRSGLDGAIHFAFASDGRDQAACRSAKAWTYRHPKRPVGVFSVMRMVGSSAVVPGVFIVHRAIARSGNRELFVRSIGSQPGPSRCVRNLLGRGAIGARLMPEVTVDLQRLQETLFGDARDAPIGEQIEILTLRFNQRQPHLCPAFDAGHLDGGLKACAGRRRPGYLQHRILESPGGNATPPTRGHRPNTIVSDSRHN